MTLGLDTLDSDKILDKANRAARSVGPHIYLGVAEFTIIGSDMRDAEQVMDTFLIRAHGWLHLVPLGAREANNLSNVRGRTRAAVLLLDHVRLGTMSIIELESSLAYTRRCLIDDGHAVADEHDLIMNMQGGRFYKR